MQEKSIFRKFEVLLPGDYLVSPSKTYYAVFGVTEAVDDVLHNPYAINVYKGEKPGSGDSQCIWTGTTSLNQSQNTAIPRYVFAFSFFSYIQLFGTDDIDILEAVREATADYGMTERYNEFITEFLPNRTRLLATYSMSDGLPGGWDRSNEFNLKLQDDGSLTWSTIDSTLKETYLWNSLVKLGPPAGIEAISSEQKQQLQSTEDTWLREVNYDEMKYTESRILYYLGNDKYSLQKQGSDTTIGNAFSAIKITKNFLGPSFAIIAQSSLIDATTPDGTSPLGAVDMSILSAKAQVELSNTYIGAGAGISLIDAQASIFNLNLGLGVSTGFGIKDDSVSGKF